MKKSILLISFLFALSPISFGKTVPVSTAKIAGYNFLHQRLSSLQSADELQLVYTSSGSADYFYVFSGNNCFVMVAAEDGVVPILGYSTKTVFRGDHLPPNAVAFFESYNGQVKNVIEKSITATPEIADSWDELVQNKPASTARKTTSVSPLLATQWDQFPYYNAYCPTDPGAGSFGGHVVTGCVATATAQVMKFWNWPAHGVGLHSYTTTSYGTLSADFGATTYAWGSMPVPKATSANAAVARLMSDVGIAVNMQYTASESGAYVITSTSPITNCAEYALKNYFDYKTSLHGEARASYTDATWTGMLKADLDAGRPIIYDGAGSGGGHCFVLDGYDGSGNFHINFGWSGFDDGYFAISAINPAGVGTGGGSGSYNSYQEAILGVEPNSGGSTTPASIALYDYVNLSASTIGYYNSFTVTTNVQNTGTTAFTGDFCAAAFDATTSAFVTFVDSVMGTSLPAGYVFSSPLTFNTSGLLAMLPGNYVIGIFYRPAGGGWSAVANSGSYTNFEPMSVVNNNYLQLYAAMTPSPAPFVKGSSGNVTLNVVNTSSFDFAGNFDVSIYNLDGTFNSTIQTMTGMSLLAGYTYTTALTFSTASITANPGTYFLALEFDDGSGYALAGTGIYQNPIYVTVVAPPPPPDVYEANNTAATAYDLSPTLAWASNMASTSTPGANFHVVTDEDYYKVVLAPGYNYSITAALSDLISPGAPYTVDAVWSYSIDGGFSWSPAYNNTLTGTIGLSGGGGGTVIFHVSAHYAGNVGSYKLNISNITRAAYIGAVPKVGLSAINIYPNPASSFLNIDMAATGINGMSAVLFDVQGKKAYTADISGQAVISIPVGTLAAGMYYLQLTTDAGILTRKITVTNAQ